MLNRFCRCTSQQIDHCISIVGFGEDDKTNPPTPYWLIRNSWGTAWARNGFFKMLRGQNCLAIETDGSWGKCPTRRVALCARCFSRSRARAQPLPRIGNSSNVLVVYQKTKAIKTSTSFRVCRLCIVHSREDCGCRCKLSSMLSHTEAALLS